MKKILAACICAGLFILPGTVHAQTQDKSKAIETLQKTVEEQNQIIQELLQRIEAVEVTQEDQGEWLEADKDVKPLWWEKVKINGDLRTRYEYIDDDSKDDDRNRARIRARLGVDAEVTPTVDVHFQLSTAGEVDGEGDPVSGNQTMDNAWSSKNIWISQAWADWHPENVPGLNILAGKIKYPFITPIKSELIFDGDVNPEGAVVKYKKSLDSTDLMANGYAFYLLENGADADPALFGAQGAVKHKFDAFGDKAHVMGGLSYYDYTHIENQGPILDGDSFGNTLVGGAFAEDFELFNIFGEFGFKVKEVPVTVFADYVTNTAADDENTGWSAGFQVGKAKEPGSWEFRYLYKDIEQDAVFGTFTDSDFGGGGTDHEGHEFNLAYQLAKNWQLAGTLFLNDKDVKGGTGEDYTRVQLDAIFKF
jgi:hypothetical protein